MKTIEQLQEENAALAAQVEALRFCLSGLVNGGKIIFNDDYEPAIAALSATPQHHLAEIRAEAGRAGYLACAAEYDLENAHASKEGIARNADQYADQIRREVK